MASEQTGVNPTLTERRVAATRADLLAAAGRLFDRIGYDATTMSAIADEAGVSRRTLYRYFETKEEFVFEEPRRWLAVFEAAMADRRPDEPTRDAFRRALGDVAAFMSADPAPVLRGVAFLAESAELRARRGRSDEEWIEHYASIIGRDVPGDADGFRLALTTSMVLIAAQNAALIVWASDPSRPVGGVLDQVLDQVDGVWPEACRQPPE